MKNKIWGSWHLNAVTGMMLGVLTGALIALIVSSVTNDSFIWSWAIPVGLACGLAIGSGASKASNKEDDA